MKRVLAVGGCLALLPMVVLLVVCMLGAVALAGAVDPAAWSTASTTSIASTSLTWAGGTAPGCASVCEVTPAGAHVVFPWVPASGFADAYPAGQCTFGAAFNFDPFPAGIGGGAPQNLGNGGDWYSTARRLGLVTLPADTLPPVGAAVSYRGFPGDGGAGHVAVVVHDDASGAGYWIYEMNVIAVNQGTQRTDVRHMTFPGDWLQGSIPAPQATSGG